MSKGFAKETKTFKGTKKVSLIKDPQGRLISWSPWPPANFQTKYPAFPLSLQY